MRWIVVIGCLLLAAGSLACGVVLSDHEAKAGSFFAAGFFLLTAMLTLIWHVLKRTDFRSQPRQTLVGLARRNAGRHAVRSALTIGLLASATFLIVAVESFHKDVGRDFLDKSNGSGGFALFAQSDVPIYDDLNSPKVRDRLDFPKEEPAGLEDSPRGVEVRFFPCRLSAGDDTSCLNLHQPSKPRILGVPHSLIERGGFSFGSILATTAEEKKNPWLLLEKPGDKGTPVFVDETSAEYILKTSLDGTFAVPDEQGQPRKLWVVGLLHESIFQSEIVLAEKQFRELFPRQEGFSFFLIEAPPNRIDNVRTAWESALSDSGLTVETTASRLQTYLAVENTYLATFQALGGLGLLLGAAGLAIVLLRSVWERRGELALLRALGFRRLALAWLVLAENAFLLLLGLLVGTAAAILAVAPQIFGGEAHVLGVRVLELLGLVVAVGLGSGLAAVLATLRAPLLQTLREE